MTLFCLFLGINHVLIVYWHRPCFDCLLATTKREAGDFASNQQMFKLGLQIEKTNSLALWMSMTFHNKQY